MSKLTEDKMLHLDITLHISFGYDTQHFNWSPCFILPARLPWIDIDLFLRNLFSLSFKQCIFKGFYLFQLLYENAFFYILSYCKKYDENDHR